MKVVAVIPARYASTRFPGKPLALLNGKPIIKHVYDAVHSSGLFTNVIVATDDERIFSAVKGFGGNIAMTSQNHKSGTDRVVEVCQNLDCDIVVNIQGDEPFVNKKVLSDIILAFEDERTQVATLYHELLDKIDITNPNVVKTVFDKDGFAMYFSRSPIPYNRDNQDDVVYYKHIGIYAFRRNVLFEFANLPQSYYEKIEKLEQLRLLENSIKIKMVKTDYEGFGIDTPQDLKKAEKLLSIDNS